MKKGGARERGERPLPIAENVSFNKRVFFTKKKPQRENPKKPARRCHKDVGTGAKWENKRSSPTRKKGTTKERTHAKKKSTEKRGKASPEGKTRTRWREDRKKG